MFERYTESARRAIFFAHAATLLNDAPKIDSSHLLYGAMWEDESRVHLLFELREAFPLCRPYPFRFANLESLPKRNPPLTEESKKILARAAMEADTLGDYMIDTEHLLLGILAEPDSAAARNLAKAGITLKGARRVVIANKPSWPPSGPAHPPGEPPSPWERWIFKWRMWRHRARS